MKLISHRGNLSGPSDLENSPQQVDKCLDLGFECEIDIRLINDIFYLGHDSPEFKIDFNWLYNRSNKLWLHCKDLDALNFFVNKFDSEFNFFWHDKDNYTLTNKGYIWAYPGVKISKNCVAVLPEKWVTGHLDLGKNDCIGICSDFIESYSNNQIFN